MIFWIAEVPEDAIIRFVCRIIIFFFLVFGDFNEMTAIF